MKEVKKCSISGVAFTMDTDAYETLNTYIESLKATYKDTPDGPEIVADIEARIAELILSTQDTARVVEKPLVDNIIAQMGSAEDIADMDADGKPSSNPRIPRRLYRDTENAKLGGVCAGIGRYFDMDPVWVRLGMFVPIFITFLHWIPFLYWVGPMFGNLFGIFVICYFIMWFAVPAARTARQKLEMNGERITEQSIRQTTTATTCNDVDSKARPIVAEIVSLVGKIVLIFLKIFAGILVFGLIMVACGLIIGIFALSVGGPEFFQMGILNNFPLSIPIICIFIALIPVALFIYVLMCLIASRKPGGKTVLVFFLLWLTTIIACTTIAIRSQHFKELRNRHFQTEQVTTNDQDDDDVDVEEQPATEVVSITTNNQDAVERQQTTEVLNITTDDKKIDLKIGKSKASLTVDHNGKKSSVEVNVTQDEAPAQTKSVKTN